MEFKCPWDDEFQTGRGVVHLRPRGSDSMDSKMKACSTKQSIRLWLLCLSPASYNSVSIVPMASPGWQQRSTSAMPVRRPTLPHRLTTPNPALLPWASEAALVSPYLAGSLILSLTTQIRNRCCLRPVLACDADERKKSGCLSIS